MCGGRRHAKRSAASEQIIATDGPMDPGVRASAIGPSIGRATGAALDIKGDG